MARLGGGSRQDPPLLRMEPFKGMNLSVTPTQIDQSQSPDMLNMNIDERGALNKRTGYTRAITQPIGAGKIQGMYLFQQTNGDETFLFAHGGKLYKTDQVPSRNNQTEAIWADDDLEQTWEV